MTVIPPTLAAEAAITKQNVALSVVKQSAEADEAFVKIIAEAAKTAPVSGSGRGSNVDIYA